MILSSRGIEDAINKKLKSRRLLRLGLVAMIVICVYLYLGNPPELIMYSLAAIGSIAIALLFFFSLFRKSILLKYDLDGDTKILYERLHQAFDEIIRCHRIWHVLSVEKTSNKKNNAGADGAVKRKKIKLNKRAPSFIKADIRPLHIPMGNVDLYFYPDMLLITDNKSVTLVDYYSVNIRCDSQRFIEDEAVPKDAAIIDTTWQHVNKSGSRDKRYKINTKLPVTCYGVIDIYNNISIHFKQVEHLGKILLSRTSVAETFSEAIDRLCLHQANKEGLI